MHNDECEMIKKELSNRKFLFFYRVLMEGLKHMDQFHDQPSVFEDTAIDGVAVLDLDMFAGREGKRGDLRRRQRNCDRLPLRLSVKPQAVLGDRYRAFAHRSKGVLAGQDHADLGRRTQREQMSARNAGRDLLADVARPVGYVADLGADMPDLMQKAQAVSLLGVTAVLAGDGRTVFDRHGKFLFAVRAQVEHLLQPFNVFALFVARLQQFLLGVGVEQERLVGALRHRLYGQGRQLVFVKQLVDIHGRSPRTKSARPLGADEITALRARRVDVGTQPFEEFVGCRRDGRRKPVLAHQPGRIDDHRLARPDHRFHLLEIVRRRLKLLFGDDPHLLHKPRQRQGTEKGFADNEGHRPPRRADEIDKIQHRLMVGNDHERSLNVFYFIAQRLTAEDQFGHQFPGDLCRAVIEKPRLLITHEFSFKKRLHANC